MHLSKTSVKHRSLGLWPAILSVAAFVAAGSLSGCIIHEDDDDDDGGPGRWETEQPEGPVIELVSIDTDQTLDAIPGEGVGLFVEYAAGGEWHLWTTCDTNYSNVACKFDAFVTVDKSSEIISVEEGDLEGYDVVEVLESGEVHFHGETASDVDNMVVTTTPGAILRLEMSLDGIANERYVYWIGNGGVLHEGAPSNPVNFQPSKP
jgi:hypothetical protein